MEKRVVWRASWLPYALVAPQIVITIVFFFWPASQAVWQSLLLQDPFAAKLEEPRIEAALQETESIDIKRARANRS